MPGERETTLEMTITRQEGATKHVARTYAGHPRLAEGDAITVRVARREPGSVSAAFHEHQVPYRRDMRIIDLLHAISDRGDSVAYRWFCSTKKCGGCAMKVNGEPKLVCWEAVASSQLTIEPIDKFPVMRDLVVDRNPYQARVKSMKLYIERDENPTWPEKITHRDIAGAYPLMDCIECGICTSNCPAYTGAGGPFPGPWALVQAAKFARDPRDRADRGELIARSGVENCMSCYRCEQVCPISIPIVTHAVEPLRGMAARAAASGPATHPLAFAENVRRNAFVHSASLFVKSKGFLASLRSLPLVVAMFTRGKTQLRAKATPASRQGVAAVFREAGEREVA
jgi:succinate dehydrogenase/fumarate reductase iron-sulfur protein